MGTQLRGCTLRAPLPLPRRRRRCPIHRLVLWNIDLTLMDVTRVSRDSYADAFRRVTGRPLVSLPQVAGRSDSEIFFESLAFNDVPTAMDETANAELLGRYFYELEAAFSARRDQLGEQGRLLPGAREAVSELAAQPGVVQSVLTGSIKPNAADKLRAFGLDRFFDLEIGGYGSDAYPRGSQLLGCRGLAADKYGAQVTAEMTVYIADTCRDVEAAAVGGARSVAVGTGRDTVAELAAAGAHVVLADLSDTESLLAAVARLTAAGGSAGSSAQAEGLPASR